MRLSELLDSVACSHELDDRQIKNVTCDSRAIAQGDLFVAIAGGRNDGHLYVPKAVQAGAAAVVCERDLGLPNQILVENSRVAYALICANYYHNPQRDLKLVGVTGTNGKTTITYLMRDILRSAGKKVGLIGTIQSEIGDMILPARHTTPDPMQLYSLLARMKAAGLEYVVMEVSSHAIDQHRVEGLRFAGAIFTNLTRDHLDYHITMENYYLAKRKLFDMCERAAVNLDDEYGARLYDEIACEKASVSIENDTADYTAHSVAFSAEGSRFIVVHGESIARVKICMPGYYSVSNAMCALACASQLGIEFHKILQGLQSCAGVLGRTELIKTGLPFTVIRDYAHDPDGLQKILSTVREFAAGRVVTLFGCPGERDRTKREGMGRVVAQNSDLAILTSDNPRSEDERQIIEDTLPGFTGGKTPPKVIADRYQAIRWAMENCRQGDILLLLGKGHEDYQVLKFGTVYFDERYIVQEIAQHMLHSDTV